MFHVEPKANFLNLEKCPSCNEPGFNPHLTVKDYSYSQFDFDLVKCNHCNLVFTNPRPIESENGQYYKSADYISHTNSTKGIIGILYKWARSINLKRKVKVLQKHSAGKRILDVGCGIGFFPKAANRFGYSSIGLEPDNDALKFAIENNKIEAYPLEKLSVLKREFDTVTMWHVLEHVYHLRDQLSQITAVIKPGGLFIIALPNYQSCDGQFYKRHWAGYDVPRHLYHFEEATVKSLINGYGFELIDVLPMKFDAYYVSMLSEGYMKGSKLKGLLNGWRSNRMAARKEKPYSSQIYVFKNKQ